MSSTPVTTEEIQQLKQIVARMEAQGLMLGSVSAGSSGAMTDASKRLREDGVESFDLYEVESWESPNSLIPSGGSQEPVPPKSVASVHQLPPGVNSIKEWGQTLCELPSVAKMKLSYAELVADPQHESYLKWISKNETGKGPRVEDLAKYLKAVAYPVGRTSDSDVKFPGSDVVRKFKWFQDFVFSCKQGLCEYVLSLVGVAVAVVSGCFCLFL